jgi:hypothetical protein
MHAPSSTSALQPTCDSIIRSAILKTLREEIEREHSEHENYRIIEEFSVAHGSARVDVAVVNGFIHGYELKSDVDTINRLPNQVREFSAVMDEMTLVVGKHHLLEAIHRVPDWWGITVAKILPEDGRVILLRLREPKQNPNLQLQKVAALLWRDEALVILEEFGFARGFRSKTRGVIYEQLAALVPAEALKLRIRSVLCTRPNQRPA